MDVPWERCRINGKLLLGLDAHHSLTLDDFRGESRHCVLLLNLDGVHLVQDVHPMEDVGKRGHEPSLIQCLVKVLLG